MRPLVLASTSRYRAALLDRLGLPYRLDASGIDEAALPGESAAAACMRLAEAKARAVAPRHPGALILGSDQIADCDGRHVGKPGTRERAREQLRAQSGRAVTFHTGVALFDAASGRCFVERVDVVSRFRVLCDSEIEAYLERESALDCAGSVRSEALGIALFDAIESDDPTALVGLPLIATCRLLRLAGVDVLDPSR
ncbi:MAG: septum formation protein Maf [Burkholderiales bacterium]|nr:septum formation protein Maf [Burkholderiales bacterium]MCE7877174.1 septum formation protein Maf [Betaproteobacteria bacterium PRO3]